MTTFLVATASVHTTAAACDYLGDRATADDTVIAVSVTEPDGDPRDAGKPADSRAPSRDTRRDAEDATNVARTRLVDPTVETITEDGNPSEVIQSLVAERDVDEVLIGARRGDPDAAPGLGGTAADLLVSLDVPVVVVPLPALS
jgi:nucleotide-binding universal stress UspA family protein